MGEVLTSIAAIDTLTTAFTTTSLESANAAHKTSSDVTNNVAAKKPPQCGPLKKKRQSAFYNLIKAAALFMLRRKAKKPKSLTPIARLFFSVSNLHLQDKPTLHSPPPPPVTLEAGEEPEPLVTSNSTPLLEFGFTSPLSSSGGMSRYASAQNFQELDNEDGDYDEESNNDAYYDGIVGDEMIDAKAEEYIAKFYQQMRRQENAAYY
ncbi:hypothetical protein Droror1_Dr00022248 [Drosera rotundifolia]